MMPFPKIPKASRGAVATDDMILSRMMSGFDLNPITILNEIQNVLECPAQ